MKRLIYTSDDLDENYDEWDPFHGKTYLISGGYESKQEDDPAKAITEWYKYQSKYPMDVAIMCKNLDDAKDLVASATPELLTRLSERYKCPYKLQYMIDEAAKKVADGCRWFHESAYGDVVHPFGVG